jgi:hypothetical protein
MNERIQLSPDPHSVPVAATDPERTPGVSCEKSGFDFWLILRVGLALIVTVVVVQLAVWWLLVHYEIPSAPMLEGESSLALDGARLPLGKRLLDLPPPHLEGIERGNSLLVLRTSLGEQQTFSVASNVHVLIKDSTASLFELREGQAVTITYHVPGEVASELGVATSIRSPPLKASPDTAFELAHATRMLTATVVRILPRSPEAARAWADVQMGRYSWADRAKGIVRIPIRAAMEELLKSREFRSGAREKSAGRIAPPGRSNSGRGSGGENP